ncbi:MerR family transcriptional regulator [Fusobacteria bacterium ZRK30]|nr:MerR family transcriptional regulator [Fusobacteria bacterium ZRK30]
MKKYLIGEVARLHNITIETLRYYDKEDLFKPAYIDKENGYRYYFPEQLIELATIIELKNLGFPLKEIKYYLNHKDIEMTTKILKTQKKIIQENIDQLLATQDEIKNKLKAIKGINKIDETVGKIIEKYIPKRNIISFFGDFKENSSTNLEYINFSKKEYQRFSEFPKEIFLGYLSGVAVSKDNLIAEKHSIFNKLFIFSKGDEGNDTISAGKYVTYLHKGDYIHLKNIYTELLNYTSQHNYTIINGSIEISLISSVITKNPDEFLTEIQILVK